MIQLISLIYAIMVGLEEASLSPRQSGWPLAWILLTLLILPTGRG
jgi:hypothetical protein